ncbi:unnamed protein product [Brassicogethes aeneus]|uniref:Uncharacterized protein n=1 Tax=Brassicogethes aeneus TaxID=1431903 RepID=A0A9P0AR79_BRAAE|nr:unnamed protein product [Brassicogethes aeneus]
MEEKTSIKGGTVCAVPGCHNNTLRKTICFFRFPKDPESFKFAAMSNTNKMAEGYPN